MRNLTFEMTVETVRQLEKAAEMAGMTVGEALEYIVKNGPSSFFALVGGVHQS